MEDPTHGFQRKGRLELEYRGTIYTLRIQGPERPKETLIWG